MNSSTITKPRILTGDTPTGRLHLGHYVGSIENRLALQDQYECYFLIANKHAFTTRSDKPQEIRQSVLDIATDWPAHEVEALKSRLPSGLILRPIYVRFYPQGSTAGHLVGYTGKTGRLSTKTLQNNEPLWPESDDALLSEEVALCRPTLKVDPLRLREEPDPSMVD